MAVAPGRLAGYSLVLFFIFSVVAAFPTAAAAESPGDAAFRADVARFVEAEMRIYPEWATAAGDHRFDSRASNLSRAGIDAQIRNASRWKKRFGAIAAKGLSSREEADREWLLAHCDGELLRDRQIRNYEKNPAMYLPTRGVYELIERSFAPLAKRMRSVTRRELASLASFQAARANLRPQTTPKAAIDITLQQMPATLEFFKKELPATFAQVRDGPAKKKFLDANGKVLVALSEYEKWLRDDLRPVASGSFAIGRAAYQRMLADDDMVDLPIPQLEVIGEHELERLQLRFRQTAGRIDPSRSPEDLLEALGRKHPSADEVIPTVAAGLEEIRRFVVEHHLAMIPSEVRPMVRKTPPYKRATIFASMDTPGPFEKAIEAYFYVTLPEPSWSAEKKEQLLEFYSPASISDISVHEVYPGHYVQFLNNRLNPDKVRALFHSGADVEGWGLYCEQMMLDQGLRNGDPRYRLLQIQMALQRAARYLVSIRMHTKGMTVQEAAEFFRTNAYMTPHNAMMEALRGTQDPGYLRYQLGKLMILKLREDLRKKQGATFDLGKFHEAFLKEGALPVRLIRRALLGSDGQLF